MVDGWHGSSGGLNNFSAKCELLVRMIHEKINFTVFFASIINDCRWLMTQFFPSIRFGIFHEEVNQATDAIGYSLGCE
jgi:hypothetical protein